MTGSSGFVKKILKEEIFNLNLKIVKKFKNVDTSALSIKQDYGLKSKKIIQIHCNKRIHAVVFSQNDVFILHF